MVLHIDRIFWATLLMPAHFYLLSAAVFFALQVWKKKWALSFLGAYMFWIMAYTVLKRDPGELLSYGFTPFWSYKALFFGGFNPVSSSELKIQIIANIAMFVPIGLLTGMIWRWRGLLFGLFFSISIEIIQLITRRGLFEFDDMMHNTLGTAIGISFVMIIRRLVDKNK